LRRPGNPAIGDEPLEPPPIAPRMGSLLRIPVCAPRLTVAFLVMATSALAVFAVRFRVDSAIDRLLPTDDPDRLYYQGVQRDFGSEEVVLVGIFAPDVFAPPVLRRIRDLTEAIGRVAGVREVSSLSNLESPVLDESGLGRQRLMAPFPHSPAETEKFRRRALAHPLARGILVAEDASAAGILVRFEAMPDEVFLARGIDARLRAAIASVPGPGQVAMTGLPTIKVQAARDMLRDLALFLPVGILVACLVLVFAFRTWRGVLLPMSTVVVGVVWTAGVMALRGDAFTMGTVILPPLLIAVGLAYAIHVVSRHYQEAGPSRTGAEAVDETMRHVRLPVFMAALTTVAGFATFVGSSIPAIRDFGVYSSLGIAVILVACLSLVPAFLVLLPPPSPGAAPPTATWLPTVLEAQTRFVLAHRGAVLVVAGVLVAASLLGIGRLRVETDYLRFFRPDSQVRADNRRIGEALAGTQLVAVVVDAGAPEGATRVDVLSALRALQRFVDRQAGVDKTVSLLDHLFLIRRVLEPESAGQPLVDQRKADQLLLLLNPEETRGSLSADHSRLDLTAHTRLSGSREVRDFVRRVEAFGARHFPAGVRVHATGTVVLLNRSADAVVAGQIACLWQVFAVLLLLMTLLFRSWRLGLLSMVPNVFPVVVLFGIMGWAGIDLNISTSMIAAMAIGIAVDDTIHYMVAFGAELRATSDRGAAAAATVRRVGQPIVVTSVALAAGFLVVCLSSFQPIEYFGILASLTMVVALLADLFLLPALLARPVGGWGAKRSGGSRSA
jgi:predicted RND superfamily exporter protein